MYGTILWGLKQEQYLKKKKRFIFAAAEKLLQLIDPRAFIEYRSKILSQNLSSS